MRRLITCCKSLRYTPNALISNPTPITKNIHGSMNNGNKNNVTLIFPYTMKYNNNQTKKLEMKLNNAGFYVSA